MRAIFITAICVVIGGVCVARHTAATTDPQSENTQPKIDSKVSNLDALLKSVAIDESPELRRCERALDKVMSFEVKEIALSDFVEHLRQSTSANFVFDVAALKAANIEITDQISVNLKDVKVKVALRMVLDPLGLTYTLRHGIIMIADKESAAQVLETRIYPIADIGLALVNNSYHDLSLEIIDLIIFTVDPDTWEDNGGDGKIEPFLPALCLVVTQLQATHEKLEEFLNTIRLSRKRADSILKQVGEKSLRETYSDAKQNQLQQMKRDAEKKRQEARDKLLEEYQKKESARKDESFQTGNNDPSRARLQQAIADANEARRATNEALQAAKRLQEEVDRFRANPQNGNRK